MYIKRLLEKSLAHATKTFPATLITGPRQSGKTTLVKKAFSPKYTYISLDEIDIRNFALEDPGSFFEQYPPPIIIDEIQNVPELLPYIKSRIDHNRAPGQWILTGSQQFPLMRNVSESLAGRIAILPLYPLAMDEICHNLRPHLPEAYAFLRHLTKAKKKVAQAPSVGSWLLNGSYPELFVNKKITKKLWFSSYLQTYIDRDVRGNIKNANLNEFERFVKLLAARTAQELNYSILSREIGVSVPTIKNWVSFLEASSIVCLLYPYHKNFGKRLIKSPKCYFMDTGLVSFLVGLQDEQHLLQGPMSGALFETGCVTQFIKRFSSLIDPCSLYFFRSVDGYEIDLLVETAKGIVPIEIKLSSTLSSQHKLSLTRWFKISSNTSQKGLIISTSGHLGIIGKNISNCHFSLL